MLPSPTKQIVRFLPDAKHAPMLSGRPDPIAQSPLEIINRWPFFTLNAWNEV
jgi:hypothetical protein